MSTEVVGVALGAPSSAERVRDMAEGKKRVMIGVRGVARMVERREPKVVRDVWRSVASTGGKSVPVRIFYGNSGFQKR